MGDETQKYRAQSLKALEELKGIVTEARDILRELKAAAAAAPAPADDDDDD